MKLSPGTQIADRYEVVKLLGSGAVGKVYHVLDRELDGQSLAIKLLHPHLAADQKVVKRFVAEALIARQLTHPNIVRVYDVVATPTLQFLTMEYIEGCTLEELLIGCPERRLPSDETIQILLQLLEGLRAAHERQVIHRDLKPSNILIDRNGTAKIADFGLAKAIDATDGLTTTGEIVGTPLYMAPEQFAGVTEPRSDLYALAIIAYELLSGAPPFAHDDPFALMRDHKTCTPSRAPLEKAQLPEWLIALLESALAKDPAQRPTSASAFSRAILSEIHVAHSESARTTITTAVRQRQRSHHLLSPVARSLVCNFWEIVVAVCFIGVILQAECRVRLATRATSIQKATGISVAPALGVLGFSAVASLDDKALFTAIDLNNGSATRIALSGYADPNIVDAHGTPAIHLALGKSEYVFESIIKGGANIEALSSDGDTPLLAAARRGLLGHMRILLEHGASIIARDRVGNNILTASTARGDTETLSELFKHRGLFLLNSQRIRNNSGMNCVHIAVEKQDGPTLAKLSMMSMDMDMRDSTGMTPLMRLVYQPISPQSSAVVAALISGSVDRNARDNAGLSVDDHIERGGIPEWRTLLASMFNDH